MSSIRESLSCGAGVLAAAVPSLLVHPHGCLAVLQPKLETELLTLLTVFQVLPGACLPIVCVLVQ